MSKNFIFGIGLLTAVGVFLFASGYALYLDGFDVLELHGYIWQLLVGSLVLASGVGILVVALLFYRHRDKQ